MENLQTGIQERARSLEIIQLARSYYDEFVAGLTTEGRQAQGAFVPYAAWSAKDVFGHITFWNIVTAIRLEAVAASMPVPAFENDQILNDREYQWRHDWTWEQIWVETLDTLERLRACVTVMRDDLVARVYDERTVSAHVFGNIIGHASLHFADYWLGQGNLRQAEVVHERTIALSGQARGEQARLTAVYNLACFYARTNQKDRALALLPNVFAGLPSLQAWAKQDADLASLHTDPAFLALYPPLP